MSLLQEFCAPHELPLDEEKEAKLNRYLDLLLQFNESMNLIGPMGRVEAMETLIVDSLVAAVARPPKGPILDVGTGAGLPGIPLKILYPEQPIDLVEPRQKRSNFLKIASHRLGLSDVGVHRLRIEDFHGEGYDFVISKAFEAPEKWLATARPRLASGGAVMVMGRRHDLPLLKERATSLKLHQVGIAETPRSTKEENGEDRIVYAFSAL